MRYDKKLIDSTIERFRLLEDKPDLYFDMDNTLYLFSTHGKCEDSLKSMYNKGFYENLQVFPECQDILKKLVCKGYTVRILSQCLDSPWCKSEKYKAIKRDFPFIADCNILLAEAGTSKLDLVHNLEDSILIDDFGNNVIEWYNLGGLAIKKTYSGKVRVVPQIKDFKELIPLLKRLGLLKER